MKGGALLILLAAALGFAPRAEAAAAANKCVLGRVAELHVEMQGLRPMLPVTINGKPVKFLLDSGAFYSAMNEDAAKALDVKLEPAPYGFKLVGVGGSVTPKIGHAAQMGLGSSKLAGVDFLVFGQGSTEGSVGMLGQDFLRQFDVEYDLAHGVIRFLKPDHCDGVSLAYWTKPGEAYSVMRTNPTTVLESHITGSAELNGDRIRVMFDTGAWRSILTRSAAAKAGVKPESEGVVSGGEIGGIGPKTVQSWISHFERFAIGGEEIRNPRLRFGATDLGDDGTDMLVGADFFLSHRLLMSNSQRQLYFTYNGGPVFNLERLDQTAANGSQTMAPSAVKVEDRDTPTDAAGFRRRGAGFAARGNYPQAIADLTRAVELQPDDAQAYFDRAEIHRAGGQAKPARADLDKAIALKPDLTAALLLRARMLIAEKEDAKARQDLEAALKADPGDDMLLTVADIEGDSIGLYDDAVRHFDRWFAANPKHEDRAIVLNQRCWMRATLGKDLDKALDDCNASLKLRPRSSATLDSRGFVRLRMGQLDAAIADYDAVIKLQPKQAWSMYCRGLAKQRKGLKDAGDADIKAALALEPRVADRAKSYGVVS